MKKIVLVCWLVSWLGTGSGTLKGETYLLEIEGTINPVVAEYIEGNLKNIAEGKTVIIRLDTPGGLMDSTHKIVQAILNTPHPVIVWVGPQGAKAASAGVFITMSADIASMAPATNIGAATPIQMGPSLPQEEKEKKKPAALERKITQDAAAYIRAIAGEKKRNWKWAEESVTKGSSITASEALEKKVIEYIFFNLEELREKLHQQKISKLKKEYILTTQGVELVKKEMEPFKKFLHQLAHPNIAFILLTLGIYGLIYGFASKEIGIGIIIGAPFLILSFFALQLLPINTTGLLLLLLGILLMVTEFFTSGFGLLLTGGIISFLFGSLILFDFPGEILRVSLTLVFTFTLATLAFFLFVLRKVVKIHQKKIITGKEGLIGILAIAKEDFNRDTRRGMVFVRGELWTAEIADFPKNGEVSIKNEEKVEVVGVEGNLLKVKKLGS